MLKTPAPTQAVVQALQGHGRRSPLYWWMRENYPTLKAAKGKDRADWKGLIVELARLGLTDINNKPPTTEIARKTWARVVKDMATKPEPKLEPTPILKLTSTPILPTPQPKPALKPKETILTPEPKQESKQADNNDPLDDVRQQVKTRSCY